MISKESILSRIEDAKLHGNTNLQGILEKALAKVKEEEGEMPMPDKETWDVKLSFADGNSERFIFDVKDAPTVVEVLELIKVEVQDKSLSKVLISKIGSFK